MVFTSFSGCPLSSIIELQWVCSKLKQRCVANSVLHALGSVFSAQVFVSQCAVTSDSLVTVLVLLMVTSLENSSFSCISAEQKEPARSLGSCMPLLVWCHWQRRLPLLDPRADQTSAKAVRSFWVSRVQEYRSWLEEIWVKGEIQLAEWKGLSKVSLPCTS